MESYKHSGKFPLLSPLLVVIAGSLGAGILGFVYVHFITFIPLIFLTLIGTCVFGLGVGFFVGIGARIGKIRNTPLLLLLTFVCVLVGIYIEWVFHAYSMSSKNPPLWNPQSLFQWASALFENGSWSIFGLTVKGWILAGLWIIEFLMIYVCAIVVSTIMTSDPFCEDCDTWTELKPEIAIFEHPGPGSPVLEKVTQGDISALFELTPTDNKASNRLVVDTNMCPQCMESAFLSLREITVQLTNEGTEEDEETIWNQMVVDKEDVARAVEAGVTSAMLDAFDEEDETDRSDED